jgi:nicotinamidase-related amidase
VAGVDNLVLAGIATDVAVESTARAGETPTADEVLTALK